MSYINEGDLVALDRWGYLEAVLDLLNNPQSGKPIPTNDDFEFSGEIILLTDSKKGDGSKACKPAKEEFRNALFVNPLAHRLNEYVERLKENGIFVLKKDTIKGYSWISRYGSHTIYLIDSWISSC